MDVLADILKWLKLKGSSFARLESFAPWGLFVPSADAICFHILERGSTTLLFEHRESLTLQPGDLVMLPSGIKHALVDSLDTVPNSFLKNLYQESSSSPKECYRYNNDISSEDLSDCASSTTISGGFSFATNMEHPLLALLPPLIHIGLEERVNVPWLEHTIQFLLDEQMQQEPGADMVIERLMELLFIQAIRYWLSVRSTEQEEWLGALRNDSIRKSLGLIHQQWQEPWTVQSLGLAVGLSRSVFASTFQSLVGQSPMQYLARWRMHVATQLLKKSDYSGLWNVAHQVGYNSEVSFSRAFKRYMGCSPVAWRRQQACP